MILRPPFLEWLQEQPEELRAHVFSALGLIGNVGPALGRPYADTLQGSELSNLKELRIQHSGHPIRALYAFDPVRRAVVLCAGDKSGDKWFYEKMIAMAEKEYARYLRECLTEKGN